MERNANNRMKIMGNRISEALKMRRISQKELSLKVGIAQSSMTGYIQGKHDPKQDVIFEMARVLDVNPAWLYGFEAPMEARNKLDVTSTEKALVLQYRQLNNDDRNKLEGFLQALLLDGKYKKGGAVDVG